MITEDGQLLLLNLNGHSGTAVDVGAIDIWRELKGRKVSG